MNTEHTPGPWKAVVEHEILDGMRQDLCPRVEDGDGRCLTELWSSTQTITYFTQKEQEANAQLMAAAPDLLLALETLREYNENIEAGRINYRPGDHISVCIAAIAKARGK